MKSVIMQTIPVFLEMWPTVVVASLYTAHNILLVHLEVRASMRSVTLCTYAHLTKYLLVKLFLPVAENVTWNKIEIYQQHFTHSIILFNAAKLVALNWAYNVALQSARSFNTWTGVSREDCRLGACWSQPSLE